MAQFVCKNKTPLTVIIILLAMLIMAIDWWFEKESSTKIQWAVFVLAVISLIYIHLIACIEEVEYDYDEEYIGVGNVPSLQEHQVNELTEDQDGECIAQYEHLDIDGPPLQKEILEGKVKTRTVFVMQPINITEEEFKEKIKPQIDMETKDTNKELPKALADPNIVIGYSLHNINKKFRSMYSDICGFAIGAEPKTEAVITDKVIAYGHKFTTERSGKTTIAFNVESDPKIRIPEKGYFEVK